MSMDVIMNVNPLEDSLMSSLKIVCARKKTNFLSYYSLLGGPVIAVLKFSYVGHLKIAARAMIVSRPEEDDRQGRKDFP